MTSLKKLLNKINSEIILEDQAANEDENEIKS